MSNRSAAPRWLSTRERPYDLRTQPMISLAAAAALGILADRASSLTLAAWLIGFAILGIVISAARKGRGWVWVMCAMTCAMAVRSRIDQYDYDHATLSKIVSEDEQPVLLRAIVRSDIQRRPSLKPIYDPKTHLEVIDPAKTKWQTQFIADVSSIRIGSEWKLFSGGLFVSVEDDFSAISPGDYVELGGDISSFSPPTNPGESDFRAVARNRNLHARLSIDSLSHAKIIQAGPIGIRRFADSLARRGERTLQNLLSDQSGPLACALVVGRRSTLDADSKNRLLETGTIHLLSVSGLHLAIVAAAMMSVCVLLGFERRSQVVVVAIGCLIFAAVTGGNPPVLRATILVATVLTSLLVNRRQSPLNTLAFAALILMVLNPTNIEQVGVQLSFISVASLLCCARSIDPAAEEIMAESFDARPQIEELVDKTRSPRELWLRMRFRHLRGLAWLSLCVTLTTTPLTWFHFHLISPVAVLANLLLGLPAALALITGLIAVVFGWVWQPLAIIPAFACDVTLRLMRLIVDGTSALPLGHAWLPSPPGWWVAIYFVALVGSFAIKRRFNHARMFVIGSLAWCAIAWLLAVAPAWEKRDALQATFIDVGHGTSVLLEMPTGENYLYDCGHLGNYEYTSRGIEDVLWSRGLTKLDAVILSHADSDHYNALPGLLHRFQIDEIITPPGLFDDPAPSLVMIREMIFQRGIPIREFSNEDKTLDADHSIQILHPPKIRLPGSDNANSLVLRIDYRGRSLLLPGDLEPPGTEAVINIPRPIPGGVLMAPHHGSLTAKSEAILAWSRPSEVIVSGSSRAKRPEVEQSLQTHGSHITVTAKHGAIQVIITSNGIIVRGFRDPSEFVFFR